MTAHAELLEYAAGEPIEAIIFGHWQGASRHWVNEDPIEAIIPASMRGKPLTLEEAKPFLQDFAIAGGYGLPDTYALYAYTPTHIIFIEQYDGATNLTRVPRHPCECTPHMPGR